MTTPVIGMAAGAKTKNPQMAQATTSFIKSTLGGKVLSLTDSYENRFR